MEEKDVEQIFQPFKQTKSNIPPATITEDTTLTAIFLFDIDNLNTHSLFSGAAINQDKPITDLYTDARVGRINIKLILNSRSAVDHAATTWIIMADGNTKTPIRKINNFLFKINGIQIPTKVFSTLLSTGTPKNFNSHSTDSMPKSQLCADTLKSNVPRNPLLNSKTHYCHQPSRPIRFHEWMTIKLNYPHHQPGKKKEKAELKKSPNYHQ
ncbi:hypothetical protein G9A89_003058 [Geosiphon pyriformis]|nr:hypothetical protein G9A89_003058 [Geosiphon pyriformis]